MIIQTKYRRNVLHTEMLVKQAHTTRNQIILKRVVPKTNVLEYWHEERGSNSMHIQNTRVCM
jgi:hypothetical protein